MNINFKKLTPFLIVFSSIVVFTLMIKLKPEAEFQKPNVIPQVVETMAAYPSEVRAKINSQGTIRPEHEIIITSEVSGKVEWISTKFLDGAGFSIGDTLMKIEKRDYELALISRESSLFQARLALEREEAEANLANIEWKRVGKGDASSLTLREPQLAQARAVLAAAEAAYEQSKRNLKRTEVIAPFDGRVRKKMVDIGANLVPGSRIADIYNTLNYEVRLPVADKDIPFLGIPLDGTTLSESSRPSVLLTTSYGGDTFQANGYIVRSESQIDPKTRMISVIATIPMNKMNKKLKVGMFVNAEIDGLSFKNITVVPRSAVKNDMIWVVEKNYLRKKSVEVIRYEDDLAFIADGLNKNDRVLVTRLDSYVDGMPVREN
jgi:RND family efflux transporter MFP subunit|tara:strand:+ start:5294 stop:6424 length:1131 start_codon:yes stop_codon:yes gene_type:complete